MGRFEDIVLDGMALLCRLFEVTPPGGEPPRAERTRMPYDSDGPQRRLAPTFFQHP